MIDVAAGSEPPWKRANASVAALRWRRGRREGEAWMLTNGSSKGAISSHGWGGPTVQERRSETEGDLIRARKANHLTVVFWSSNFYWGGTAVNAKDAVPP